ncbi:hypothetical protein [Paenibacillus glacialis]|nr:hypothetical protein [Paenibacillus glacialis]
MRNVGVFAHVDAGKATTTEHRRKFIDLGQTSSGDIAVSQSKIGDVLGSSVGVPPSPGIAILYLPFKYIYKISM